MEDKVKFFKINHVINVVKRRKKSYPEAIQEIKDIVAGRF